MPKEDVYAVIYCECSKKYYAKKNYEAHKFTTKHITYFMDLEDKCRILKESYC